MCYAMSHMKKPHLLVGSLSGLLFLGAGCNQAAPTQQSATNVPNPTPAAAPVASTGNCDNPYYPLKKGTKAAYTSNVGGRASSYSWEVTDATEPRRNAAGKTAGENIDDLKTSVSQATIINSLALRWGPLHLAIGPDSKPWRLRPRHFGQMGRVDGQRVDDPGLTFAAGNTHVFQVGKRRYARPIARA